MRGLRDIARSSTAAGATLAVVAWCGSAQASSPAEHAAARRHDAEEACARSEWSQCLKALDDTDEVDPAGAHDPHERELRKAAQAGLGLPEDGKPR